MIIDAHAHIGSGWLGWPNPCANLDEFIQMYDKCKVDKICINSWNVIYDPFAGNREVALATRKYPLRLIGLAVVSPHWRTKGMLKEIDQCINDYAMKGIKVHASACGFCVDSSIMDPVVKRAIKYNIPILLHSWHDNYSNPRLIGNLAERFPSAKLIIAHMGGERWLEAVSVAKKHENVYLDTAASFPEKWVIPTAVEECREDKIIWGSDAPALDIASELAKVTNAPISSEVKEKILCENSKQLFNL